MAKQQKESKTHTMPQPQTAGQSPFFQPVLNNGQNSCKGWLSDMESLTKRAAEHYAQELQFGPAVAESHSVENNGKWHVWQVRTLLDTKVVKVSIVGLPNYIVVRHDGKNVKPHRYSFVCDAQGQIHFTRISQP